MCDCGYMHLWKNVGVGAKSSFSSINFYYVLGIVMCSRKLITDAVVLELESMLLIIIIYICYINISVKYFKVQVEIYKTEIIFKNTCIY